MLLQRQLEFIPFFPFNSRASGHASSRGCHRQQHSCTCHLVVAFQPERRRHWIFRLCKQPAPQDRDGRARVPPPPRPDSLHCLWHSGANIAGWSLSSWVCYIKQVGCVSKCIPSILVTGDVFGREGERKEGSWSGLNLCTVGKQVSPWREESDDNMEKSVMRTVTVIITNSPMISMTSPELS